MSITDNQDPLIELQLRVARRADELARLFTLRTGINLACWLQAEREILENDEPLNAPPSPVFAGGGANSAA